MSYHILRYGTNADITHSFQHSLDKIKSYSKKEKKQTLKKSIENLIDYYGP